MSVRVIVISVIVESCLSANACALLELTEDGVGIHSQARGDSAGGFLRQRSMPSGSRETDFGGASAFEQVRQF